MSDHQEQWQEQLEQIRVALDQKGFRGASVGIRGAAAQPPRLKHRSAADR
jgi:hypothetical protein